VIRFEGVSKRYGDGTVAVDDLALEIPTGQITVLVGPSGCGKTTSLRMINRMIDPTEGRILIDDEDIRTVDPPTLRRRIGYVIQSGGLLPHRNIVDNIATVPFLLGWDKKKARARSMELLERVGLPATFAKRYPYQLSGGQQQRVGVARALAADPPVMLMDEPFSAVDPVVRKSLQEEFLRLQSDLEKTIVFVTHDVDEAIKLGNQIAVLRTGGKLAQFAAPQDMLAHPQDSFVESFLGSDRGIRRLSFFAATGLSLRDDPIVPASASGAEARTVASETGAEWLLVVDGERRPLGWLGAGHAGSQPTLDGADLVPYGHTFQVDTDSLRAALDSAVLSPTGYAVGVDAEGRVIGVVALPDVTAALRANGRAAEADAEAPQPAGDAS
jgi:osmoprotectant transport system ATP-binding protein